MVSLVGLVAQLEHEDASSSSASIANLERKAQLQRRAYDQAIADLAAARAREGLPVERPLPDIGDGPKLSPSQVAQTAALIVRMGKVLRGELLLDATPPQPPTAPPKTDEERASIAAFIVNAGKKARNEQ